MTRSTVYYNVDPDNLKKAVKDVLAKHKNSKDKVLGLYNRWNQEQLQIQNRELPDKDKPNNVLAHDFRGYIVRQLIGYLFGNPVLYQVDKRGYDESKYDQLQTALSDFITLNMMDDLDSELGKLTSIAGYAGRLMYINTDAKVRLINVNPWQCVFIMFRGKITHAIRYIEEKDEKNNVTTYAEIYDDKEVNFFIGKDQNFVPDPNEKSGPHLLKNIPLILFKNNEEETGDFEKAEDLINAYDKMQSDAVNEVETFANAYMSFKDVTVDAEVIKKMRQTGGIEIGENGEVKFITKDINDSFFRNNKKDVSEDIHKFTDSVDMGDEKFSGGAQTGESRKWKLLALENKAGMKVRKMSKGLRYQYRVLCGVWELKSNIKMNYLDIFWKFKRNLPIDLLYIADYIQKVKGAHSMRTLLEQVPYIDDVDYELSLLAAEEEEYLDKRGYDLDKVGEANERVPGASPTDRETDGEQSQIDNT